MWVHTFDMKEEIAIVDEPIYAHIYNRGVDKRSIFKSDRDRNRFMLTMRIALLQGAEKVSLILRKREKELISSISQHTLTQLYGPPMVTILAFCLMPNHYHIIVKANRQEDISKFAQRLANSYTLYFNKKYDRKGRLFESTYKEVVIRTDEQLVHVVRYVHTNPSNSKRLMFNVRQLRVYQWSSLPAYLRRESRMCDIEQVLSFYSSIDDFWKFTKAGIKHQENIDSELLIDNR